MVNTEQKPPYWRLSNFYLFYFASLGALVPYWSLYLKSLEFSAREIGELMAVLMLTKIVSPNIWGWIADQSGRRMRIVRLGAALATVSFFGVYFTESYWGLALVMLLFSFFWNAVLPQFEATTLSYLGAEHRRYSMIRLWGSIGFILTVASLGPLLQTEGAGLLLPVLSLLFIGIWLSSMSLNDKEGLTHQQSEIRLRHLLMKPAVIALLLTSFFMQASHGPYYTFYTIYMEGLGYSRGVIGQLWALGVVAEVLIFLFMHRMIDRFGLYPLMSAALVLTILRWALIGLFPLNLPIMLGAQTLHAASFGIFHAVAIALFHHHFRGRHHGKGQALYSSLSFGAGGALGAAGSGWLWDIIGGAATFYIASVLALFALISSLYGQYHDR